MQDLKEGMYKGQSFPLSMGRFLPQAYAMKADGLAKTIIDRWANGRQVTDSLKQAATDCLQHTTPIVASCLQKAGAAHDFSKMKINWCLELAPGMFMTTYHTLVKAKKEYSEDPIDEKDNFSLLASGKEYSITKNPDAVIPARIPDAPIGRTEGSDCPIFIAPKGTSADSIKGIAERFQMMTGEVKLPLSMITAFEAQKISSIESMEASKGNPRISGDDYFTFCSHENGKNFIHGDSGTPYISAADGPGGKRRIGIHSGASASGMGLLMILKRLPNEPHFVYDKATEGGFGVQGAMNIVRGYLRNQTSLQQALGIGGESTNPRVVEGADILMQFSSDLGNVGSSSKAASSDEPKPQEDQPRKRNEPKSRADGDDDWRGRHRNGEEEAAPQTKPAAKTYVKNKKES